VNFREVSQKYLEPASQWIMGIGVVMLCQPWVEILYSYSVTVILIGLVGFNVFSKIKPKVAPLPPTEAPQVH
jgi:hypothetical protein